jgi:hypothetical protein
MAFKIQLNNYMLEVWGSLNAQNMNTLRTHLELVRKSSDFITLSLDHISDIDMVSAKELEYLYYDIAGSNKVLSIVGQHNSNIQDVMLQTKTSYILSNDRS